MRERLGINVEEGGKMMEEFDCWLALCGGLCLSRWLRNQFLVSPRGGAGVFCVA